MQPKQQLLALLPNYASHRFIAWRAYHQRLGSSYVVYRSVALARHRSVALPTLSLYRLIAPPLGCRGDALLRTALLQGPERAERRAVHAEQRLQIGEWRVKSTEEPAYQT